MNAPTPAPGSELSPELRARFDREVSEHPVVLYMKGNALFPMCGFSAAALDILKKYGDVHTVDVLTEPEVREGIKRYSSWPTLPQVYIRGQFVGGADILRELDQQDELRALIEGDEE